MAKPLKPNEVKNAACQEVLITGDELTRDGRRAEPPSDPDLYLGSTTHPTRRLRTWVSRHSRQWIA